jgi:hypothetical protein
MRKLVLLIILIIAGSIAFYHRSILKFVAYNFVYKYEILEQPISGYPKKGTYHFVQETDNFYPEDKQDILNIIFTSINNGWQEFTFICAYEYDNCESDMAAIAQDAEVLTNLNNYVHPFNSYDRLHISINGLGKIKIEVVPLYSEAQIIEINNWIDDVINKKLKDTMSIRNKLETIHNHIIDKTVYDKPRSDAIKDRIEMVDNYSHIAYGIVYEGKAVCGGYADMYAIFLEKLNIPNFKVSTDNHVWNLVYYNNEWLHVDLTWDDPYTGTSKNLRYDDYFLIDTAQLWKLDVEQHNFDRNIFKEAK